MEYSRTLSKYLVTVRNENGYQKEVERQEVEDMDRPDYPYIKGVGMAVSVDGRKATYDMDTGRAWIFNDEGQWEIAHLFKDPFSINPITATERKSRRVIGGYNV